MALVNIIMPKLGESIMEATVLKWHKKVGDVVSLDETLLDIATDKVDSEVPSTASGVLEEILCNENDVITIGSVIGKIRTNAPEPSVVSAPSLAPSSQNGIAVNGTAQQQEEIRIPFQPSEMAVPHKQENGRFFSPLVMNIASREGIPFSELEYIKGSGNDGRVTKSDILSYLEQRGNNQQQVVRQSFAPTPVQAAPPAYVQQHPVTPPAQPEVTTSGNVEVIEMDRMRKYISNHMTMSLATSAHVTSFAEADVTNLVAWRDKSKKEFEKREGEKITFTPLFIEAIVKCIKKYPMLNSSVVGDNIIIKKDINIGMATALPNGNLIVPVIKYADQFNIIGLAKQVNRLANSARTGKLQPFDTQDGTFTFTNVGTFGSLMGTPIINQPQVAIIATGAIKKKPVVIESDKGDSIAIRHMMFVSMSYDHRIIDGGMGSLFLAAFVEALESFDVNRTF
ncbi:MAG: 2-oxo acid dehydrogenase subunit E2 [Chitinophagaceae bacterium]|jgi:2-oxoglutarate dehydrogenase E2 component (dihydrolipoamide succinyltransferase)|nr:2-oxo acid dehydrogenase subunit E2 [Chitinophagaceae bacterium]